ncbi:hypothetical protein ACFL96_19320, partial [Thermoproteota archaeon]
MMEIKSKLKSEIKWIQVIGIFVMLDTISTLIAIEFFGYSEHNFIARFLFRHIFFPLNYII